MDREETANIYGRIVALEITTRTLVTALICQSYPEPLKGLAQIERDTFSSLQNADRPIGDFNDQCWEEAVDALEQMFAAVESRIKTLFPPA